MTISEIFVILIGFVVGYVVVLSFLLRNKDKSIFGPDFARNSNNSEQQNSSQANENSSVHGDNSGRQNDDPNIRTIDDCFAILELENIATSEDIKYAYRRKMKGYHPDKVAHLGEKLKKMADLETKKLNSAYSMLKDAGYISNV